MRYEAFGERHPSANLRLDGIPVSVDKALKYEMTSSSSRIVTCFFKRFTYGLDLALLKS